MGVSEVAADGSPVEVYLALPARPEFDPVLDVLSAGCSVLDLGCGTGRLVDLLTELGCETVGVDESAAMLSHVADSATTVRGRIEDLDLGRTFDVVVLAGNLINTADLEQRAAFLEAVRRHLGVDGQALVQRYDPHWAATVAEQDGTAGPVHVRFRIEGRDGPVFAARSTFTVGDRSWLQSFRARVVDDAEMRTGLARADLAVDRWLTSRWIIARRRAWNPAGGGGVPRVSG